MVSGLQRHLSIFLVVVLTTSWFVLPQSVRAQGVGATNPEGTDPSNEAEIPQDRLLTYDQALTLTKKGTFISRGFSVDQKDPTIIYHEFAFQAAVNEPNAKYPQLKSSHIYRQIYKKSNDTAWGGCKDARDVPDSQPPCNKETPSNYTLFTPTNIGKRAVKVQVLNSGDGSVSEEDGSEEVYSELEAYKMVGDPLSPVLLRKDKVVYGLFTLDKSGSRPQYVRTKVSATVKMLQHYVAWLNCAYIPDSLYQEANCPRYYSLAQDGESPTAGSEAGRANLASLLKQWFDPDSSNPVTSNQFTLRDSTQTAATDTLPAPVVTVSPGGSLPYQLIFRLKYVVTDSSKNYFLFEADTSSLPAAVQSTVDPKDTYLAIDLTGNIAFVQTTSSVTQERAISSRIITTGHSALGKFDTAPTSPFKIDPTSYRDVITKRVYNEQFIDSSDKPVQQNGAWCDSSRLIFWPNENTTYDKYKSRYSYHSNSGIPDPDHRICLNPTKLDSQISWLAKWGVEYANPTASTNQKDPCNEVFAKSNPVGKVIGGALCGLMQIVIGGATWFAGFSIDFLVEAVGLQ